MANFITEDLSNVTITVCNAIIKDETHDCFRIITKDENGNQYVWNDTTTAGDANESTLIDSVKAHMLTLEKKAAPSIPVMSITKRSDVIGGTLG